MTPPRIDRRPATEGDVPFLTELRRRTMTAHQVASGLTPSDEERRRRVLVRYECAEVLSCEGREMGLLKVARDGLEWVLIQIQLAPQFQGRGIGEQLVRGVAREAHAAGAALYLSVLKANPARRLYERLGFVQIGEGEFEFEMVLDARK